MKNLTEESTVMIGNATITNKEHNVLMVALEYLLDNLDNMVGDFDTFQEENENLKEIETIKSLQKLFRL